MVPQGAVARKRLLANLADVRTLARMDALVVLEVRRLRELHPAHVTPVGLLPGVYPRVVLQIRRLRKRQTADIAFEVLLARMQTFVRPETRISTERTWNRVVETDFKWIRRVFTRKHDLPLHILHRKGLS